MKEKDKKEITINSYSTFFKSIPEANTPQNKCTTECLNPYEILNKLIESRKENEIFLKESDSWIDQEKTGICFFEYKNKLKNCAKSIKKLNDNFILYDEKQIFLFDSFLKDELASIKFKEAIVYVSELKSEVEKKHIIVSLKGGTVLKLKISINKGIKQLIIEKSKQYAYDINLIIDIKQDKYIFSNNKGTFFYKYKEEHAENISDESFVIGEVINNRYALLFNNLNSKGNIKYFDSEKEQNKIKALKEFDTAFILSQNCIILMNLENIKVLLCAFENSIKTIKLELDDEKLLINNLNYYELDDCNINCLCPIENLYSNEILGKKKFIAPSFFVVNITINNESEFRVYNLEYFEDNTINRKIFIKSNIKDNGYNDFSNKVYSINQLHNGHFVIIKKKDNKNRKTSEGVIKIYQFKKEDSYIL